MSSSLLVPRPSKYGVAAARMCILTPSQPCTIEPMILLAVLSLIPSTSRSLALLSTQTLRHESIPFSYALDI